MRTSTSFRTAASVILCGMVIAACGQKAGVRVDGEGLPGGQPLAGEQVVTEGGPATDEGVAGDVAVPTDGASATEAGGTEGAGGGATATTGGTSTGGTSTGTSTGGATGGGSTNDGSTGGDQGGDPGAGGGGQGTVKPQGSDRTGAGEDQIVVGIHAPATGAAPLPTTSFEQARATYWRWITEKKGQTVLGRSKVSVLYRDDKYDPSSAGQVCKEMAARAFMLAGGGGTDQIQRCGQLASVSGFPYFSAGVTEAGLRDNPWYFAASMSYRQQGGLLAQYVRKNPDGIPRLGNKAKIATIITDTPNFDDALQGWLQGLADNGLKNIMTIEHPKGDTSWYASAAEQLSQAGVNTVYILSSPVDYMQFANTAEERYGFNPQYIGVGVSMGLNAVLDAGCNEDPAKTIGSGIFMSPYYGLDVAKELAPEFFEASKTYGAPQDDIALALWGLAEGQHKLFQKYGETFGNDLTREDFRAFVEAGAGTTENTVYPPVTYSQNNHFGASKAHFLKANCTTKQYETLQRFAAGF